MRSRYAILTVSVAAAAMHAVAITATKEYVDRRDAENATSATNLVVSATNAVATATVAELAKKADAQRRISVNTGSGATNLVVRPVYANANLVIRECETANGQKQYRLIRKED